MIPPEERAFRLDFSHSRAASGVLSARVARYSVRFAFLFVVSFCFACGDDADPGRTDSGAADSGGPIMDSATDAGGSGPCEEGEACNADDDGCTVDICRRGRCVTGTNSACDDGASCTVDECRSTGAMTFECDRRIGPNFCAIDSMCYRNDEPNPTNLCQVCESGSPMTWTVLAAECDDQDACTMGDTCETGECVGLPIVDDYEDNPTRGEAAMLEEVSDSDTFPAETEVEGTVFPEGDEDWFIYRDNDSRTGRIFPRVDLQRIPEGANYELCAFVSCTESETEGVECVAGTETMFDGVAGCCSDAASNLDESVKLDHTCRGGIFNDDTADVFVRVRQTEGRLTCRGGYTMLYGDD